MNCLLPEFVLGETASHYPDLVATSIGALWALTPDSYEPVDGVLLRLADEAQGSRR
jgi:hypothetical protein